MRVLAADIGGTSIRAALVEQDGRIIERRSAPTPPDPEAGLGALQVMWTELGPADASALVVAGGLSQKTGEITQSPNLPRWEGVRPAAALGGCAVLNDANGALLGEAWLGALRGVRSAVLLTLGTGVGGAVLLDRALWTGSAGCAGEIGHACVDPSGPACPCGSTGCVELYASASAVARSAGASDGAQAAARARQGDARSVEAFRQAGEALGVALASVVNLFNPEAICIGGGLSAAFDLLEPPLRETLRRRAFRLAVEELELLCARLGGDAGLLGAARAALDARE